MADANEVITGSDYKRMVLGAYTNTTLRKWRVIQLNTGKGWSSGQLFWGAKFKEPPLGQLRVFSKTKSLLFCIFLYMICKVNAAGGICHHHTNTTLRKWRVIQQLRRNPSHSLYLSVYIEFVFSKMQTTPRIGFWLDNSNQTPQQTAENILNARKPV